MACNTSSGFGKQLSFPLSISSPEDLCLDIKLTSVKEQERELSN